MIKTMPYANSNHEYNKDNRRTIVKKHPIKLTALLYLKEALQRQRYEDCQELIGVAREFGAAEFEIKDLLEDPRRSPG
jgi:hypothetical protein